MDIVLVWLPHRKCIVKILIGHKYCQTFEQQGSEIFCNRSSSTTIEPNFKIMCNYIIHELLNVFEDSAQREHTISSQKLCASWKHAKQLSNELQSKQLY